MVRCALDGNFDKARKLHYKLLEITQAIFIDGNPSGVKGLLSALNICSEYLRLPLVNVSKATLNRFEILLKEV
jgi:4-hydroxy-tetrahydrodipicolinate synthase